MPRLYKDHGADDDDALSSSSCREECFWANVKDE
jgi:hypothetical protein